MATTSPPIPELAEAVRVAVARTHRRMRQEAGVGMGPSLIGALATIERHGPLTPSEVAAREAIRRPTATRLVARLEELGLITRREDPADRRVALLSITDAGHAALQEQRERKNAYLAGRLAGMPEADRATLARATELLTGLLDEDGGRV